MAVSEEITLPAQGSNAQNHYSVLGGDGWTSPQSVHEVAMSLPGAAGGGNSTITVNFDPRFQGIMTYVLARNDGASTAIEILLTLGPGAPRSVPQAQAFFNQIPLNSLATSNVATWCPPPLPHFRKITSLMVNTDGDTHKLFFYLYNFNIRVLEKVPLAIILASLPRADSQFPTTGA